MNSKKRFKAYSDSGHGWVAVKRKLLAELGIIDKVTKFSYEKGQTIYLEEDQDLTLFADVWKEKYGEYPKYNEGMSVDFSPIRSYDSFTLRQGEY